MTHDESAYTFALLVGGVALIAQSSYGLWKGELKPFRTTYRYIRSKEPGAFYRVIGIMMTGGIIACVLGLRGLVSN